MNFVFVTYPYHYHITLVSITKLIKLYDSDIDTITILFDDCDKKLNSKFNFFESFQKELQTLNIIARAIPFSSFEVCIDFASGWERQQIIKLNLHKILEYDDYFCIDGDTLLQEKLDLYKLYINLLNAVFPLPHHYNFVNYVLDLNYQKVCIDDTILETLSGVPIRYVKKHTLKSLESYVYDLHNCDICNILKSFTLKKNITRYFEISEWDVIGHYEILIAKNHATIEHLMVNPISTLEFADTICNDKIKVLEGNDDLPKHWYKKQDIDINLNVFTALGYKN